MRRHGSEDPHQRERKFLSMNFLILLHLCVTKQKFWQEYHFGSWFQGKFIFEFSASADGGPRSRVRARGTLRLAPHRH